MKRRHTTFALICTVGLLACAVLSMNVRSATAGPPAQVTYTPRPQITPTSSATVLPPPSPPVTPTRDGPPPIISSAVRPSPPRLRGTIFDWGHGTMPEGVKVVLSGDGWELPVATDKSGEYVFRDIGNEVASLNAFIPDGRGDLVRLASDLPVRTSAGTELIVNMAFHAKDLEPETLIGLEIVSSGARIARGEVVEYTLTVTNNWVRGINQVIVADPLPQDLTYTGASASQGSVTYDRGLVWAELGHIPVGKRATVTILAKVNGGVEGSSVIVNRAAAYHSENVAVQSEVSIEAVERSWGVLPVTGLASTIPFAILFILGALWAARRTHRGST